MKKLLTILAIMLLVAGTVYATGRTDAEDVTVDLQITGDFGMSFPFGTEVDLGSGLAGAPVDMQTSLTQITAGSQYDEEWTVSVECSKFVGVTPTNEFTGEDAAVLQYMGLEWILPQGETSKGVSTYANAPAQPPYKAIPTKVADGGTGPQLFYTPNAGTYNDVHNFYLAMGPTLPNVATDSYSATISVSMAETQ